MNDDKKRNTRALTRVLILSLVLILFALPHTLEDFSTGEPAEAGISPIRLSLVVAVIFSLQALGLYWLGKKKRRGLFIQAGIGLFWSLASGVAQLPTILSGVPYRSGFISVLFVGGIIAVGVLLLVFSLHGVFLLKKKAV